MDPTTFISFLSGLGPVVCCGIPIVSGIIAAMIFNSKGSKDLSPALGFFIGAAFPVVGIGIAYFFANQTEKKIASGAMKVCHHCGNVVTPRDSTCPVCQKTIN